MNINGVRLPPERVKSLQKQYGIRIVSGDYCYDKTGAVMIGR